MVRALMKTAGVKSKRLADKAIAACARTTPLQAVAKLTEVVDGHRRIVDQLPLVGHVPGDDELSRITALFDNYGATLPDERKHLLDRYRLVDAARKVVGVGSVGTCCWIALLNGGSEDDDPLILQVKEADASILEAHLQPSDYRNHGRRVVEGQLLLQAASDMFLGWSSDPVGGTNYYWRQLRDMKASADINAQPLRAFLAYAELCGMTLARAHARSGDAAGSPDTSAKAPSSPTPSHASPPATPTKTIATTPHSNKRSKTAASLPNPASDQRLRMFVERAV